MENRFLSSLSSLTMSQKTTLAKGKVKTISDLLLKKPTDVASQCRISLKELEALIDLVCNELYQPPDLLRDVADLGEETITTGDTTLDSVLGGGFRTSMVWEISGENNAGKTQLALQLSLTTQLPPRLGGVSGATCYITTRDSLRTERLNQVIDCHNLLSHEHCTLSDVQTVRAFNYGAFNRVLDEAIPKLVEDCAASLTLKPVKLLVIDTFSDLFDSAKDPQFEDLLFRASVLRKVSLRLQQLATKHRIAVVLLGSTRTTHARDDGDTSGPGELPYSDQSRWFARAHTVTGEDAHEAGLGHVWHSQPNARIMMSRTTRTRYRDEIAPRTQQQNDEPAAKRRRLDFEGNSSSSQPRPPVSQSANDERIAFRRFSVIFSSAAPPASCDYVILEQGVVAFAVEEPPPSTFLYATPTPPPLLSGTPSSQANVPTQRSVTTPAPRDSSAPLRIAQSLSYVTAPPSPRSTPPRLAERSRAVEDPEDAMLWELTQDHGDLFDRLPDSALGDGDEEAAGEGPPAEDHDSSDGELWRNFSDVDD